MQQATKGPALSLKIVEVKSQLNSPTNGLFSWRTRRGAKRVLWSLLASLMDNFHHRVRVSSVCKGSHFHRQKWPWPGLSRIELYSQYYCVLQYYCTHSTTPLRYSEPERVPASLRYTRRKRRKLSLWKKMFGGWQKFAIHLGRPTLLLFVHVLLFTDLYQATLCRSAMRARFLRTCRGCRRPA